MNRNHPGFLKMIRAPFLSSIILPLSIGSLLSFHINGKLDALNLIIVFIMGICLHIATNVYNDIYDTLQGTDKINANRNEFSGGSGVLVADPGLLPLMVRIARFGLIGAAAATIALWFRIDAGLRMTLIVLFFSSVFFSKYYTAAPVKLAYRGLGEFFVWLAFGPMAVLVAAVSQHAGFHRTIILAMPISGISTLSILLIGQMIDIEADKATGKWGVAVRFGIRTTSAVYVIVQILLCINVIILSIVSFHGNPILLASLIPYFILLPKIIKLLNKNQNQPKLLKNAAKLNVLLHLSFSVVFLLGLIIIH
jgi:1,4-dihydroxy-2-naphthoate polyprenyltransferase